MIRAIASAAAVCAFILGLGLTARAIDKRASKTPASSTAISGIVRLHELESGNFTCTGFVVGKTTLFTAAHCIPETQTLEVRAANGEKTGIIVFAVGVSPRADLAIMRGRLSRFTPLPYSHDPKVILNSAMNGIGSALACGYPYGGRLLCSEVTSLRMFAFQFAGLGNLYPGMSGGPVLDRATGTVVAVNSAVNSDYVFLSPLIEIYAACSVTPEP